MRSKLPYLILMGTCLLLLVLSWTVVRRYSAPTAVAMTIVALAIPPVAAIVANAGREGGGQDRNGHGPPSRGVFWWHRSGGPGEARARNLAGAAQDQAGLHHDSPCRGPIAIDPGEQQGRGVRPKPERILGHNGDGRADPFGQGKVVKPDQRDPGSVIAQRTDCADGHEVVAAEEGTGRLGEGKELANGGGGVCGAAYAVLDIGRYRSEAAGREGREIAGVTLLSCPDVLSIANVGNAVVSTIEQLLDRGFGACPVVDQDGVDFESVGWSVDADDLGPECHLSREEALTPGHRYDDQAVDAAGAERGDDLLFTTRIVVGAGHKDEVIALVRRVLHGAGQGGVEGVGDVVDNQPDRAGPWPLAAQVPGEIVALVAKLLDRLLYPRGPFLRDAGVTVDHS